MVGGVPATEQPSIDSAIEAIREASVSHIELPRDASRSHLDATGLQITPGHPSFLSRSHDSSLLTSFDTESASKSYVHNTDFCLLFLSPAIKRRSYIQNVGNYHNTSIFSALEVDHCP